MKKSFSVLLSAAVAFGSFASFASAADELTAQQKFDALKAKGIFTGVNAAGDAGLDQNMNRAQFARVAALILGLEGIGNPDTLKVTEKPFPDVDLGKWYTEEVSAVKAAKVLVGNADGTFNPEGNISVQELAVVTANLLGLKAVEGAKVEGAADWAAGYIQAIKDAGVDFPTNYTQAATRAQLVSISYQADAQLNPVAPAKASVTSAKAAGVKTVTVTLDKAVDTDKATLTLKRGTATVATTAKWSDDKKSATLTLTSTKISDADYSVVLGGIAAEEIATASASFKGEDEKVAKIEFVTASDEIAKSSKARIKLKASNQYGEDASFSAANYTVSTDVAYGALVKKDGDGSLVVELNTTSGTPGLTQIPLYVYNNDNHVTATKTFKLGFAPFASKLEVGAAKYSNGKDGLTAVGDKVAYDLTVLDQYGNPITASQTDGAVAPAVPVPTITAASFNKYVTPYLNYNAGADQEVAITFADTDADDEFEATLELKKALDKATVHNLTVYVGSASQTVAFNVNTSKVVTKIDWDTFDGVLAQGDTSILLPLVAYDANGDQLTAQEIADNASRINVTPSGATSATIITVGPNKGKVKVSGITATEKSYVFVTASVLTSNASSFKSTQVLVNAPRIPTSIAVATAPKAKAVLGASSGFDFSVKDQYGSEINGDFGTGTTRYKVAFSFTADAGSGITVGAVDTTDTSVANGGYTFATTNGSVGSATLKAVVQKSVNSGATYSDVSSPAAVTIEAIANNSKLTYALEDITSLYAAISNSAVSGIDATDVGTITDGPVKSVSLVVKDQAGNSVAYPDLLQDSASSDLNVVKVATSAGKVYVYGDKAGEASVTTVVYKANGETASLTSKVTVKADAVAVDKLTANGDKNVASGAVDGLVAYTGNLMDLKAYDQYGIEYAGAEANAYNALLGIRYSVSEVVGATVSVNPTTGVVSFTDLGTATDPYQFVLTATAPNGKSVSTVISNN